MSLIDLLKSADEFGVGSYHDSSLFVVSKQDASKVKKLLNDNQIKSHRFDSAYVFEREFYAEDAIRDCLAKEEKDEVTTAVLAVGYRSDLARELTPCSDYKMALKKAEEYIEENRSDFDIVVKESEEDGKEQTI